MVPGVITQKCRGMTTAPLHANVITGSNQDTKTELAPTQSLRMVVRTVLENHTLLTSVSVLSKNVQVTVSFYAVKIILLWINSS